MKAVLLILLFVFIFTLSYYPTNFAFGQEQPGGVNLPGDWYVGESLKQGDFFSYNLCHFNYNECQDFRIDFWFKGDTQVGTETKWLVPTVVYDGNKIVKGTMELGKFIPEPSGGSPELRDYRSALKNSVIWLSAYATPDEPRKFSAPSWGKIGNIGGQQIRTVQIQPLDTTYDHFPQTVRVEWRTGGSDSKVWVVDEFPFPVKAYTFVHVAEGIPPTEYRFEILDYKQNVNQDPFSGIVSKGLETIAEGCPTNFQPTSIKKSTQNFQYLLEVFYGPKNPSQGCLIEWTINFKNKFHETEFLNQVQYDIWVVDDKQSVPPLRSIADEQGRLFLYTPSGQVKTKTIVKEPVGTAHYVIWVYGLNPQNIVPPPSQRDFLPIDITIAAKPGLPAQLNIPSWIKNNAGWWAEGSIDDNSFVQGIQYLIKEGIMRIPPTSQGTSTGTNEIPSWIKNNAGWWADGLISDSDFVKGIQYLIEKGIMKIA